MGGLGANIGTEEWERAKRKAEAAQEYARSLRTGQALAGGPPIKRGPPKEKTARERALEFAKSIPKPRGAGGSQKADKQSSEEASNVIEEEPYDEYGNTIKFSDYNELNARHDSLLGEVDQIKRLFH